MVRTAGIRTAGVCLMLSMITPAAYAQSDSVAQPMAEGGAGAMAEQSIYQVFFALGSAELDSDAMSTVAAAANWYKLGGAPSISVTGHADTTGSPAVNEEVSRRRAQAVADALVGFGVSESAITQNAVGQSDLLVPTGEGVAERQNRRVEIRLEPMQAEEPVAEAAPPAAATGPVEEVADVIRRGKFGIGLYYGANLLDQGDDSGQDTHHVTHLLGLNLTFDYLLLDWLNLSLEQAGFYNVDTDDDGIGGRTAAGLDFVFPVGQGGFGAVTSFLPYVGVNLGGIYGSGLDDDFFWGPEIGVNLGPIQAKIAYDAPFDRDFDEGIISTTIGVGIPF
ncbi:MAG TPA: OmpA family protein [Geminicoccus sp.]|uniref:OmpA family protein n=1 Tax=Geminicoccus sp. TaxID=2024832 RepID=UPI002BB887F4|nr:OmpA family protein [Geminicoccus sp.]HWL68333.1 OmpA family protein [Geminicoccus sp.]